MNQFPAPQQIYEEKVTGFEPKQFQDKKKTNKKKTQIHFVFSTNMFQQSLHWHVSPCWFELSKAHGIPEHMLGFDLRLCEYNESVTWPWEYPILLFLKKGIQNANKFEKEHREHLWPSPISTEELG